MESAAISTVSKKWPVKESGVGSGRKKRQDNSVSEDEIRAFLDALKLTPEQITEIENVPQRTKAWFEARNNRLPASLAGAVAGHKRFETKRDVLQNMMWPTPFSNDATEYGTAMEAAAFQHVEAVLVHDLGERGFGNVWLQETGTRIMHQHPWLCASTDAVLHAVGGRDGAALRGVVELKAPYYKKTFYEPTPHYYYDQFSMQAAIHDVDLIVFGVYTPEATQVNYFKRDVAYWERVLFPALQTFYMNDFVPRAILRQRGRIRFPNIDPEPCILVDPFGLDSPPPPPPPHPGRLPSSATTAHDPEQSPSAVRCAEREKEGNVFPKRAPPLCFLDDPAFLAEPWLFETTDGSVV